MESNTKYKFSIEFRGMGESFHNAHATYFEKTHPSDVSFKSCQTYWKERFNVEIRRFGMEHPYSYYFDFVDEGAYILFMLEWS